MCRSNIYKVFNTCTLVNLCFILIFISNQHGLFFEKQSVLIPTPTVFEKQSELVATPTLLEPWVIVTQKRAAVNFISRVCNSKFQSAATF